MRPHITSLVAGGLLVGFLHLPTRALAVAAPQACESRSACLRANCHGLRGAERMRCKADCRQQHEPPLGTVAYLVTSCHVDATGSSSHQELRIQRGYCPAVTAASFAVKDTSAAQTDPSVYTFLNIICQTFGHERSGGGAELAAPMHRVAVSPDGRRVLFHLSDTDLPLNLAFQDLLHINLGIQLSADIPQGFYVVNSDGSDLRWLGNKVRVPPSHLITNGSLDTSKWARDGQGGVIFISPNGRLATYVDYDSEPGSSGDGYLQVMTLNLDTGQRSQITQLQYEPCTLSEGNLELSYPYFIDDQTITFAWNVPREPGLSCRSVEHNAITRLCIIHTDGQGLDCKDAPAFGGQPIQIDPRISISNKRSYPAVIAVARADDPARPVVLEIFMKTGRDFLQLTNFGHGDLNLRYFDRNRIYLSTSIDPSGQNPAHRCELFSISTSANGLRQLTHFNYDENGNLLYGDATNVGCVFKSTGCAIGTTFQDVHTRTVVFESNCDPFHTGYFGEQVFAMRPDTTQLRQLTHTTGCVGDCRPDTPRSGSSTVELPSNMAYGSSPIH